VIGIALSLHAGASVSESGVSETPPTISATETIAKAKNFHLTKAPKLLSDSGVESEVPEKAAEPANLASSSSIIVQQKQRMPDSPREIYQRNKLEFSLEGGWLPINVPFMFDFLVGDAYIVEAVHYTMVPVFTSLDWQMGRVSGPLFLRGTWDATFGGTAAAIPRGPEARFFGYHMGIRRNFVQRRWRVVPYLDGRVGIGHIDARGPQGVWGAQGQDLVFSLNISSGVRYQLTRRYAISGGVGYMHISNMYLSLPTYANNGINVVGLMVGLHMRILDRQQRTE
jgi:hypothetical protein